VTKCKHEVWTDGGCEPNPGPGGWACVIKLHGGHKTEHSGYGGDHTTNNRMELRAAIEGLKAILVIANAERKRQTVVICSDSAYVVNGVNHPNRLQKWRGNGFYKSNGKPLLNSEMWKEMVKLLDSNKLEITFKKVKAHVGLTDNERADELCTIEIILNRPLK